jgi:hypothetical protein
LISKTNKILLTKKLGKLLGPLEDVSVRRLGIIGR